MNLKDAKIITKESLKKTIQTNPEAPGMCDCACTDNVEKTRTANSQDCACDFE
ncbi:MAG: hypothetical protein ACD_48C00693G0004 [uncultured bacterium]|nr:MAG: hypothetical protein ACD_48C00693G0004 [uncultured bacterium]